MKKFIALALVVSSISLSACQLIIVNDSKQGSRIRVSYYPLPTNSHLPVETIINSELRKIADPGQTIKLDFKAATKKNPVKIRVGLPSHQELILTQKPTACPDRPVTLSIEKLLRHGLEEKDRKFFDLKIEHPDSGKPIRR